MLLVFKVCNYFVNNRFILNKYILYIYIHVYLSEEKHNDPSDLQKTSKMYCYQKKLINTNN